MSFYVALGSLLDVAHTVGYPVLFLLVMAESAGVPVPGETSIITGAVLASQGKLSIVVVIVLAATAAIVGDNIGYLDRAQGRPLAAAAPRRLPAPAPARARGRRTVLRASRSESGLLRALHPRPARVGLVARGRDAHALALVLPLERVRGIVWATGVGVIAYTLGRTATNVTEAFEIYGLAAFVIAIAGLLLAHRRYRRSEQRAREEFAPITKESRPRGRLRCDDDRSDMARSDSTSR